MSSFHPFILSGFAKIPHLLFTSMYLKGYLILTTCFLWNTLRDSMINEWWYQLSMTDYDWSKKKGLPTGHALGIWICGCSLFYRRELWASKFAGFNSTKSLKICGCQMWRYKISRVPGASDTCANESPKRGWKFIFPTLFQWWTQQEADLVEIEPSEKPKAM